MSPGAAARLAAAVDGATTVEAFGDVHVDVAAPAWDQALRVARDELELTFFDWLSAYDDPPYGFAVVVHLVGADPGERVLLRTRVPAGDPVLRSATSLWPGAAWHERETWEMFGIGFEGHPGLEPLLLQPEFEGRPLRKDFVLASRMVKDWPGAKDPTDVPGRARRRPLLPPGVPTGWGGP
jgi:NADH-quinone oxidoreductase subunit C